MHPGMRAVLASLVATTCAACGGDDAAAHGDDGPGSGDAAVPLVRCDAPALVDTASPTSTVGDGTAASCTAAALQAAATAGGVIAFACGSAPVTIVVTSPITVTRETVLDGGGLVTLSGGGTTRIVYVDSAYDQTGPRLTVQRLRFIDGRSAATGDDTADGGGAIYRDGGSLTVIDSVFENNRAPATGQDVAGGAIYGFGGGETVIVGSSFHGNEASDGGAVGTLNGDVTIINSVFTQNRATGSGGNPGNGGCGGALYQDGRDQATSLCGVEIRDNTAGAIGGGVFRVSNTDDGTFAMDRSTVDGNAVMADGEGNAGGLYLQGLAVTITASTISRNQAHYNGGIWINERSVDMTNVTIAENIATGSNGGGIWLGNQPTGTLRNVTIANNRSTAANQIAGAIFGEGVTLVNSIVAGNSAMYTPNCNEPHGPGATNLQFPGSAPCTVDPVVMDPLLGALADNGGDTATMRPAAGSPAQGLGAACPPTDQAGHPRPATGCTVGAMEAP